MIGRLERVPLREVWRHEAQDFTRWLVGNPDVLENVIGLSLAELAPEQAAGAFRVDITGEVREGGLIVVENQLGPSDHNHLGKLVTYVAARNASVAVWIVADPRPEHIGAVTWLNEGGTARFYLVKVEAVRIGGSEPAPLLTLITGPSEEVLEVGEDKKKELAGRHHEREEFWAALLKLAKARSRLFAAVSPSRDSWVAAGAGRSGILYVFRVRQHEAAVEFSVERPSADDNAKAFAMLQDQRAEIETAFGSALEFEQRGGRRGSFWLGKTLEAGGYRDPDRWPELHAAMVDAMEHLENATRPYISKLGL